MRGVVADGVAIMPKYHVRAAIGRDMPSLLKIELDHNFMNPWTEEYFKEVLFQPGVTSIAVVDSADRIYGFMIISDRFDETTVLNFGVRGELEQAHYQKISEMLFAKAQSTLNDKAKLIFRVRESDLSLQRTLKTLGIKCKKVERKFFETTDSREDSFTFELTPKEELCAGK